MSCLLPFRRARLLLSLGVALAGAGVASAQRARPSLPPPCGGRLEELFPNPQVETLSAPSSPVIADLDGDGRADLAVGHEGAPAVSVYLGLGRGRLAPRTDVASAFCQALVALDVEGDGDLDLALAEQAGDHVVLLQNLGNGTFVSGGDRAVGDGPGDLIAVDLGLDGRADLVTADTAADRLSVLVNQGGGSFGGPHPIAVGDWPTSLTAIDVERDGRPDLAVACFGARKVQLLGNLGATFAPPLDLDSHPSPGRVAAADLDGDTYPELVALTNPLAPFDSSSISVYPNDPLLGLGPASVTPRSLVQFHATSIDFDDDGDLDLAVTSGSASVPSYGVSLYSYDGAGLSLEQGHGASEGAFLSTTGDLDGDGRNDLAVVNGYADSVSLLFQHELVVQPRIETPYGPHSMDSADLDGDGDRDLAITAYSMFGAEAAVQLNQGQGAFGPYASYPLDGAWEVECADLDGDADVDLAVGRINSLIDFSWLEVLQNQGGGSFTNGTIVPIGEGVQSIVASDLDGDGDLDLATANETSGDLSMLRNQGGGTFDVPASITARTGVWCLASADLDLDGDRDLVVSNRTAGLVTWLRNDGTASFPARTAINGLDGAGNLACADLDGDGDRDLAVASLTRPSLFLLENLNAGAGSFTGATTVDLGGGLGGISGSDVVAADLDHDGRLDWVVPRSEYSAVTLVRGNGTLAPTFRTRRGVNALPQDALALDLDEDGDFDLLTLDSASANVTWLQNACR